MMWQNMGPRHRQGYMTTLDIKTPGMFPWVLIFRAGEHESTW